MTEKPGIVNDRVIANQSSDWCGNLLHKMGIPTPVFAPARNDIVVYNARFVGYLEISTTLELWTR